MKKSRIILNVLVSLILVNSFIIETTFGLNTSVGLLSQDEVLNSEQTLDNELEASFVDLGGNDKVNILQSSIDLSETTTQSDLNLQTFNELEADDLYIDNEKSTDSIEKEIKKVKIQNNKNNQNNVSAMSIYGNDPNSAIFIDQSMYGTVYSNTADANEDWYYTYLNAGNKLTVRLTQPNNGDYDIYLYQLNGSSLTLVAQSYYSGSMSEQLSYAGNAAYYFLRVVPYQVASSGSNYQFMFSKSLSYDAAEGDDNIFSAKQLQNGITVNQTIDNAYDQDWFIYDARNDDWFIDFKLNNVPSGSEYSVLVYDSNLNIKASFSSTSNASRLLQIPNGIYYIQIRSLNGIFNPSISYRFSVTKRCKDSNSSAVLTPSGELFQIQNGNACFDGIPMNITWETTSILPPTGLPYTRRYQSITRYNYGGIKVVTPTSPIPVGLYIGYTADGDYEYEIRGSNVALVKITNFFYNRQITGKNYEPRPVLEPESYYIAIDLDTKKVIDFEAGNLYYDSSVGYRYSNVWMEKTNYIRYEPPRNIYS